MISKNQASEIERIINQGIERGNMAGCVVAIGDSSGALLELPPIELKESVQRISKRLGGQATKEAIASIHSGDLKRCTEICLDYYDKTYSHSASRNGRQITLDVTAAVSGDQNVVPEMLRLADEITSCNVSS